MNQETKKNVIRAVDILLEVLYYDEVEKQADWEDIQAQYPDRRVLDRLIERLDQIITFNVPGKTLRIFARKFLAHTQLTKDETIEALTILKNKGAIIAMDIEGLEKPGLVDPRLIFVIEVNKKKLINYKSVLLGRQTVQETFPPKIKPNGWEVVEDEHKAYIVKDGKTLFTFPSKTSNQYRYFKYLWDNYGAYIPYPEAYEHGTKLDYPNRRGENWKANTSAQNAIRKLRELLKDEKVPIEIETDHGFILTINE